jgi:hypothetical protein
VTTVGRGRGSIKRMIRDFYTDTKRWPTEVDFEDDDVADCVREYGSFRQALHAAQQSAKARKHKRGAVPGVKSTDAMWRRLPGSFEMGKRR